MSDQLALKICSKQKRARILQITETAPSTETGTNNRVKVSPAAQVAPLTRSDMKKRNRETEAKRRVAE